MEGDRFARSELEAPKRELRIGSKSSVFDARAARYNVYMSGNGLSDLIVLTPGTCGRRARINGWRIPVSSVYRWFLSGLSPEDILAKYEGIALAQVYAAIAYALANR